MKFFLKWLPIAIPIPVMHLKMIDKHHASNKKYKIDFLISDNNKCIKCFSFFFSIINIYKHIVSEYKLILGNVMYVGKT